MFYTADAPGSTSYEDVLWEYNRLIATGVDKVFQISIVSSHVKTTYGGVVLEDAPASTSGFVSSSQAASTEISLDGYTFSRYGKGYLMKPVRGSAYLGNDYFLGGWWNESAGGWFFRRDCVRTLYELGAQFDGPTRSDPTRKFQQDTTSTSTSSSSEVDLTGRYYREYGKGLLLFPLSTEDPFYGQKYLLDGWWMDTQKGWFFKKEHYQWLRDHGAIKATEDEQDEQDNTEIDLSNMTLWSYGKGWLLEPLQDNENYGQKYFHSGWWMSQQDAWFFKDEDYQWLIDNGAIKATEDDNDNDSDSTVDTLRVKKIYYF